MNTFVTQIDLALAEKLKQDLLQQGFTLSSLAYAVFSAKKPGVSCTLYTSGKLVVQGKGKQEFITYYLEPEILQNFSFSYPQATTPNVEARIGVDEAGKGDFFGPLCVAAVFADQTNFQKLLDLGVKDSKQLSDPVVIKIASNIRSFFPHSLVILAPSTYNQLYEKFKNLNSLLAWGHATAIEELVQQTNCKNVWIDQFASEHVVENALARKKLEVSLTQRHKGEEDLVVAAASILARAAFLQGLKSLGDMIHTPLPKGASAQVITMGKKIFAKFGKEMLTKLCKLHFKTTQAVLDA